MITIGDLGITFPNGIRIAPDGSLEGIPADSPLGQQLLKFKAEVSPEPEFGTQQKFSQRPYLKCKKGIS